MHNVLYYIHRLVMKEKDTLLNSDAARSSATLDSVTPSTPSTVPEAAPPTDAALSAPATSTPAAAAPRSASASTDVTSTPSAAAPPTDAALSAPATSTPAAAAPRSASAAALRAPYRHIHAETFPEKIELSFIAHDGERETLHYKKIRWQHNKERAGLRYGENPAQKAALYQLRNEYITLNDTAVHCNTLEQISGSELLRSGKHPSKINICDLDCGVRLLRYNMTTPTAIIIKHNNPCAVACAPHIADALRRAYAADSTSAFGGVVILNRTVDIETAEKISAHYFELIAAPDYEEGAIAHLEKKQNLRIVRIKNIDALTTSAPRLFEMQSLSDLSICLQEQYRSHIINKDALHPAHSSHKDVAYRSTFPLADANAADALFGWHVVESLWSNAVLFVKEGCTVGIGCGAVDRVGAVHIAINKAYRNYKERFTQEHFQTSYHLADAGTRAQADAAALTDNGGLAGSVLCSDAFFPFADGVECAMRERPAAIVEPGGSIQDWQVIDACNRGRTPLIFTGQRAFRH